MQGGISIKIPLKKIGKRAREKLRKGNKKVRKKSKS